MNKRNLLSIIFIIFCLFLISACGGNNNQTDYTNQLNKALENLPTYIYEGEKLDLPSSVDGEAVSYSVDKPEYFNNNFEVIQTNPSKNEIVTITASIHNQQQSAQVKVHQTMANYFEKVFDHLGGNIPSGVVNKDINLQTTYLKDDITITYISNHPEYVTNDGKRVDHEYDEDICLTCQLSKHGFTAEKDYLFVSQGIAYEQRLDKAVALIDDFMANATFTDGTKLPTTLPNYGGRFRWVCEDPSLIDDYETLHLPFEAKTVFFMVEIYYTANAYKVLKYRVSLSQTTKTELEYVTEFIQTTSQMGDDYLILYEGLAPVINTEYLVDSKQIEKPLLRKVFYQDGRPSISQTCLNERVYPGYQLNNDTNVLWIVTHETGMSYAGDDALLLGKSQYTNAYGEGGSDRASWNYTVDDHSIYQSYADTVACWHATDGKSEGGGNYNGIGIELCVNSDGNFELAMRNDARLMAYLLLKHNLGILNMKQHHDFYEPKDCPYNIRRNVRWFEYLSMISREYISQKYLSKYEITYETTMTSTPIEGIYNLTNQQLDQFNIYINGTLINNN